MGSRLVRYSGANTTTRLPSGAIWHDCPNPSAFLDNVGLGVHIWDDFTEGCPDGGTTLIGGGKYGYSVYGATASVLAGEEGDAAYAGGVLEISGNSTDNDECNISMAAPSFVISDTEWLARKLWFECRIKKASITDEAIAVFVGLGYDDTTGLDLAVNNCLNDDEAELGAYTFLGFHCDLSNADSFDFVYMADGQTAVVHTAGIHVPVADTWVKLGFKYDPDADDARKIATFVNGVEQTTWVTAAQIAHATNYFPDNEAMAMLLATKVGGGAESKVQMDWWRCAQLAIPQGDALMTSIT